MKTVRKVVNSGDFLPVFVAFLLKIIVLEFDTVVGERGIVQMVPTVIKQFL